MILGVRTENIVHEWLLLAGTTHLVEPAIYAVCSHGLPITLRLTSIAANS
jgi:hypothetical protein